jgi:NAD(P)-dependent dehydrogenase (short-subunit alcohol dehydrogenase family)
VFDLTGRLALVTGSSRGIGRAIAITLAEAGAAVAVHGRETTDALEDVRAATSGNGGVAVTGNLKDPQIARRIVDEAAEQLGGLDILVNNAGDVIPTRATDLDAATWDSVIDVNLRGAFFCAQAAETHMCMRGSGRIVNVSSVAAEAAIPSYVHYGASKAGLNAMTRYLAVEWAAHGITVNAVAPAFVRTELAAEVFRRVPDLYDDQLARVPKRRMCEPYEVAATVLYLVSAEADFTTGAILHVDGGYLSQ